MTSTQQSAQSITSLSGKRYKFKFTAKKCVPVKTIEQGRVETAKERNVRVGHKVSGGVVYRWGIAHDSDALKYCRGGCCGLINKDFCFNCEHGEGMDKEWDGDWKGADGYCLGCDYNPTTNHHREFDSDNEE